MTYEEALKYLDEHCTARVIPLEVKIRCSKALEKQIPKKPMRAKCQLCNHYIPGVVREARMRFCPFCGQKIDWSDDE